MRSQTPKFSIVVPMYNVERFLPKCVDSLCSQTLKDIEIIMVDDGSPDRCGEIAEAYALKDSRVQVVHRVNGGLGPARNSGMEIARGEYIGFVDSDDWVDSNMFERLYAAASDYQADIVFTGLRTVRHGEVVSVREHPFAGKTLQGGDDILTLRASFYGAAPMRVLDDPVPISVWVAGYRRDFIENHHLRFLDIRSEDKFFNTYACRVAKTVTCIDGAPYCYRKDDQSSITKTFKRGTIDSFCTLFRALEQMADEESPAVWYECHLREQRCIVDYCRSLIGMIEFSSEDNTVKNTYIDKVMRNPVLRRACSGYPWWKLPFTQSVFYLVLKFRSVRLARFLMQIKGERI